VAHALLCWPKLRLSVLLRDGEVPSRATNDGPHRPCPSLHGSSLVGIGQQALVIFTPRSPAVYGHLVATHLPQLQHQVCGVCVCLLLSATLPNLLSHICIGANSGSVIHWTVPSPCIGIRFALQMYQDLGHTMINAAFTIVTARLKIYDLVSHDVTPALLFNLVRDGAIHIGARTPGNVTPTRYLGPNQNLLVVSTRCLCSNGPHNFYFLEPKAHKATLMPGTVTFVSRLAL
jgi:hypothetical protein